MQTTREMNQWDYFYHAGELSHCFNKNHRHLFLDATHRRINGKDKDGNIFIHFVGDNAAGVSGWYVKDNRAYLRWHGVREKYQHMGVSKTLLDAVKKDIRSHGYTQLFEEAIGEHSKSYFIQNGFVDITNSHRDELDSFFNYLLSIDL